MTLQQVIMVQIPLPNNTGILYITQNTDDANFLLRADNGSGGVQIMLC